MTEPEQQGAGPGAAAVEGLIGTKVGNFKLTDKVGTGGMGVVYIAEHELMGKKAAVKVLLPELSSNKEIVARFFNEARAATRINHPGIVDIYDFGYHQTGHAYIVMEYLAGESLSALMKKGLHLGRVVDIAWQLGSALSAAHARGIIHRDVKPDNVFIVPDPATPTGDRVKVLDFGIAKLVVDETAGGLRTRTGAMMGTPVYMSPEQCRGAGEVDHRSDIYAMGVIMFEMACGQPPFVRRGFGELITAHMYEMPPRLSSLNRSIPAEYEAIVMRMLEKDPTARYQSAEEVETDLAALNPDALATISAVTAVGDTGSGRNKLRRRRLSGVNPVPASAVAPAVTIPDRALLHPGRRRLPWLMAAAAILGVAVAGWLISMRGTQLPPAGGAGPEPLREGSGAPAAAPIESAATPAPAPLESRESTTAQPAPLSPFEADVAAAHSPAESPVVAPPGHRPTLPASKVSGLHRRKKAVSPGAASGAAAGESVPAKQRSWGDLVDP